MQTCLEPDLFPLEAQLNQYRTYLAAHFEKGKQDTAIHGSRPPGPAITLSHQTGGLSPNLSTN